MVNFIQGLKKYAKSSQDAETKRHSISLIRIREKHDDKHNKRASLCGGALQFSRGASAADIQDSLDDRSTIKASLVRQDGSNYKQGRASKEGSRGGERVASEGTAVNKTGPSLSSS